MGGKYMKICRENEKKKRILYYGVDGLAKDF